MMSDLSGTDRDVSRETSDRLSALEGLLRKWNPVVNLVSKESLKDARTRHIADSQQLYTLAPRDFRRWVDLGSGGGFPGLVVAILAAEHNPDAEVILVESDQRKAAFLQQAARALGVKATIFAERIEALSPQKADVLSARALAALPILCRFAERHLEPGGVAIFPKGANHQAEIAEAQQSHDFGVLVLPSVTDKNAAILVLKNIKAR